MNYYEIVFEGSPNRRYLYKSKLELPVGGKKTIVKCQNGETWDPEKALALCYMKRVLGNRGSFNETLKKYCWEEEK